MSIRIGDVIEAESTYRDFLSGSPFAYRVEGLPEGESALVARFGNHWSTLRPQDPEPEWRGKYASPQAAVSSLGTKSEEQASTGPLPHDGVAHQAEDDRWSIYRVEANHSLTLIAGPYEKSEAMSRLKEAVRGNGDQWVIDRWGVATILN